MIRSWEGTVRPGAADEYLVYLTDVVTAELHAVPGCLAVRIMRGVRDRDHFVVQTHWVDAESITQFAGPDPELAVVPPEARALLAEFQDRARHFEVVADLLPGTG